MINDKHKISQASFTQGRRSVIMTHKRSHLVDLGWFFTVLFCKDVRLTSREGRRCHAEGGVL